MGLGRTATHLNEPPAVALNVNHLREKGSCLLAQNKDPRKSNVAKTGMKSVTGRKNAQTAQNNFPRPSDGKGAKGESISPAPFGFSLCWSGSAIGIQGQA
jgi:hypothetical protein